MESICGAKCLECELKNKCKGCKNTNGCPFLKKCWIAKYIEIGGKDNFKLFKNGLIDEVNSLNVEGMTKIEELYPLNGELINLEYILPNKEKVKFLNNDEVYLGNEIECEFNDELKKYFGVVVNMDFILICEYEENRSNPEIILYKKR